jgi:hypothetical protein
LPSSDQFTLEAADLSDTIHPAMTILDLDGLQMGSNGFYAGLLRRSYFKIELLQQVVATPLR